MKNVELRSLMKELEGNSISVQKFLSIYCGISAENILNVKISHADLKILMPQLKRVGFDSLLKDKTDLYVGNIIAVRDSYGNIAPYKSPEMELNYESYDVCVESNKDKEIKKIIVNEDLNTYELSQLCKKFKISGRMREFRIAYSILKTKKDKRVKDYKNKKLLLKIKGREQ